MENNVSQLSTIIHSYDMLISILPIIMLGLFCGIATYFNNFENKPDFKPSWRKFIANSISSSILGLILFALMDTTDFSYMQKLGVSGIVAFLGVEKGLDFIIKFFTNLGSFLKKG